jgi:spermidine/putrescine transport system substrate-binding protein/spermidine/putrescine transport system permease protein
MKPVPHRLLGLAACALAVATLLAGCAGKEPTPGGARGVEGGELNIYIWSEYLPQEVIDAFSKRTGVKVRFDLYDSNEAMLEKLQSGVADYDFIVPSDYMVRILIAERLIQPIDKSKLPMGNLDPRFLDKEFDPGNRYSVPYLWGTTGLGYDKQKVGAVDSWEAVFDPRHKGRILMLDDVREVFGVALRTMGKSINERDPAVLAQAAEKLKRQKALVATYNSGDFANILAAGDVDLAQGFNGQLAEVAQAHPERLAFVVPKEGGTLWMDNVCIPTKARHVRNALAFLAYVMEPEVNAKIVNGVHYASANLPARKLIEPQILRDPAIFPDDATLARCELLEDLGDTTTLLDQYWTEIKAR